MTVHLLFVIFVVLGGLLALRWRRAVWLHLPAIAWGTYIAATGGICPLTPLENWLRARAGGANYTGGFVERYLMPILYPGEITVSQQALEVAVVVFANAVIYSLVWRRMRTERRASSIA